MSYSDSEIASKVNKNHSSTFKIQIKIHSYSLKIDDGALFNNGSKIPSFVISPLKSVLNFEVYRLSLQQLEYEMDCTYNPVSCNFSEIVYCGHPNFPYANIWFKQATNLILSHFQE